MRKCHYLSDNWSSVRLAVHGAGQADRVKGIVNVEDITPPGKPTQGTLVWAIWCWAWKCWILHMWLGGRARERETDRQTDRQRERERERERERGEREWGWGGVLLTAMTLRVSRSVSDCSRMASWSALRRFSWRCCSASVEPALLTNSWRKERTLK